MKYIYIYINLLVFTFGKSQNLVPNPSFETYTICPVSGDHDAINSAVPWKNGTNTGSVDYYNLCAGNSDYGIPYNFGNYQYPRSGNAYVGFVFLAEFLQVQLITPLIQNKTYYVEFNVVLHSAGWASGSNNIAANLSVTKPIPTPTSIPTPYETLPISSHIMTLGNPIISDTLNWVKVSGCYTAQGGEEYLTIGNFFDKNNTQTNGSGTPYYLVDDVKVEEITGTCVTGLEEMSDESGVMNIYPNPTDGILNITTTKFKDKAYMNIKLYDVLGKEVLSTMYKEELDISNLEKGIYFLSVYQNKQLLITKKVVKE